MSDTQKRHTEMRFEADPEKLNGLTSGIEVILVTAITSLVF